MQQIIIYLNIKPYRILFFSKIRAWSITTAFCMTTQSLASFVISFHVIIFPYTCGVATISLLKLTCIIIEMDSRMEIRNISRILKMIVRWASQSVSASSYA
jgi:hypothetical protein